MKLDIEEVACGITWRFLRLAWLKKGCPLKNAKRKGIGKWTVEDARKQ